MYYGGYYGMYWDPTYILVIIGMVICLLASAREKSTYAKFYRVRSQSGITAAEAAEKILHGAGIYDVEIRHISGDLTDNYDPSNRVLNLSDATFRSSSVAAIGVAAHECGHAIQDAESYAPLKIRGAIVPVVNFGATISWPLILIGIVLGGSRTLIMLGVLLFSLTVIFQLVTLPVEFNASSRALIRIFFMMMRFPEQERFLRQRHLLMLQQRLLLFYSFCVSFYCLATAGMIKRYDRN